MEPLRLRYGSLNAGPYGRSMHCVPRPSIVDVVQPGKLYSCNNHLQLVLPLDPQ